MPLSSRYHAPPLPLALLGRRCLLRCSVMSSLRDTIVAPAPDARPAGEGFPGKAASVAQSRGGFSLPTHLRSRALPINEVIGRRLDHACELADRADARCLQSVFEAADRGNCHAALLSQFLLRKQRALSRISQAS